MSEPRKRKKFSPNNEMILFKQVQGICPHCSIFLMHEKNGNLTKRYELAHIYPLNPTPDEKDMLKDEELLHEDIDHPDNLIPLCNNCHEEFDNPRSVEEYRKLVALKKNLLREEAEKAMWHVHAVEKELDIIIKALTSEAEDILCKIQYTAKEVNEKLDDNMSAILKRKIKNNVQDYYLFIRSKIKDIDSKSPGTGDVILSQVKLYYNKQKKEYNEQSKIFENICSWMYNKTGMVSRDAAEILTSFFIQNCEVF